MKIRILAYIGFTMMIAGFIFAVVETVYFGNNWLPQTRDEILCDCISLSVTGAGCTILLTCIVHEFIRRVNELFNL